MNHAKHTLRDVVLINTEGLGADGGCNGECVAIARETSGEPALTFARKKMASFGMAKSRRLMLPSPWSSASVPKNRIAAVTTS